MRTVTGRRIGSPYRVDMVWLRTASLVLCVPVVLGATGCAKARAETVTVGPPLDVPIPPPRVLAPLEEPVPEVVEAPATPEVEPSAPRPAANREAGRRTRSATGQEPAAAQAPIEPEPLEPLELRASPSGSAGLTERGVRAALEGALRDLRGVDYGSLSADGRAQYLQSRRFAEQAAEALVGRNIEFAATLAEKSASLAAELRGRQ